MRRTKLLLLSLFSFVLVTSQIKSPGEEELHAAHRKAMNLYNAATEISKAANYDEEKEKELNQKALDHFLTLADKIPDHPASFDSLKFHTNFIIGELYHYFENYPAALKYYELAIQKKKKSSLPDSLLLRPFIYSGLIYYQQNRINTAALYFNMADSVQQKYKQPIRESERMYNTLGVIHYETGNFRMAMFYFQKALDLLPQSSPYYTALMTNYKINIAHIHFTLEEYEEANKIYRELLSFNTNHNEIYLNLGMINLNLGAPEKAIENFNRVKEENNPKLLRLYNNKAKAFLDLGKLDSAHHYLKLAMSSQQNIIADQAAHGSSLKTMGDLYMALDSPAKAIEYFARAVSQFYPAYTNLSVKENPGKFSGVFSFTNLFSALLAKAQAFHELYQKSADISWAVEELEAYQSAFKLVSYVEKTYSSDEARIFINRYRYEVHSRPIDIAYELYKKTGDKKYIEALYVIDQQNKASVLALNQARMTSRIIKDSALVRQEKEIKTSITRNLLKASQTRDSAQQAAYAKEIADQEISLDRIQKQISPQGPANMIPSTRQLQKEMLDRKTAIVSFHLSPDRITIVLIKASELEAYQVPIEESFHDDIRKYIASVRDPSKTPDASGGKKLYEILFGSVELSSAERLIIIPDDELNFLPFESLKNAQGNYLFENYSIQYQYSTAVLKKQLRENEEHGSIAFAPFALHAYQKDSVAFGRLPFSFKEVDEIKGQKFIGKAATRNSFLQQVSGSQVVHLATHAVAGEGAGESFIVFSADEKTGNDFLYAEEIYNLELKNTHLVILSACETGAGKLVKGEGVMSLSRAFTYAGCPNIITSLWKADDMSTAYLAKKLHEYLDRGFPIDRAMQAARKDFFHDPKVHPSYKHPYYWSHLIFIGNYETEKTYGLWWIGGGLLIVILIIVYRRKLFN